MAMVSIVNWQPTGGLMVQDHIMSHSCLDALACVIVS